MRPAEEASSHHLNLWDSVAVVLGIVVGVGIFRVPAIVAQSLPHSFFILLAWFVAGMICLLGALCYAELASTFPRSGGNYVYLKEGYGPLTAFLFGWSEFTVIRNGAVAAVALVLGESVISLLGLGDNCIKAAAILAVGAIAAVNLFGLKAGKTVQNVFVGLFFSSLAFVILYGFGRGGGDFDRFRTASLAQTGGVWRSFAAVLVPILWAYGGWHENTFLTGETKLPAKTIVRALISAILIVTVLYIVINAFYIYYLPLSRIAEEKNVMAEIMRVLFQEKGKRMIEVIVILTSISSINGTLLAGSRITHAMVSLKWRPEPALAVNAAWVIGLIIWGNFEKLLFFTGIAFWLFMALSASALVVIRIRKPNLTRPYCVPGYPVVPLVFIFACLGLCLNILRQYPDESLRGLILVGTGIPVYYLAMRKCNSSQFR